MNGPFDCRQPQIVTAVPIDPHSESLDQYRALQAAIFQDIAPRSAIEWLLAIDIAELT
ncbi:hypothetical protein IVA80_05795 [Bradyrhizobium sp. 139]|uniref:hypothetical protein n=1 Tax=Bradyrhizobium sp. 139 TaxID=2782616 RepID=UPI001FFBE3CF|nr:hypothetical protein [Bradyrhizobium sp. 139]MCK1740390.1 hypothetical protein [Bradyrhizobium sp. 139]